jgi:hypothetical protein
MRANMVGPPRLATSNNVSTALCHSGAVCSFRDNSWMYSPASRSVCSLPPSGRMMGSSNFRCHPRSLMARAFFVSSEIVLRLRSALEHARQRDLQGLADFEQPRRAHAVHALFVFLNLLKCDAQHLAHLSLTKAKVIPALPHSGTNIGVHRCWASGMGLFLIDGAQPESGYS